MDLSDASISKAEMITLRERIKHRYAQYHAANRDKYPSFDFNSNRVNYLPLKNSFEEEFFEQRQIDRIHNHLHIPSLKTFAQIFSNDAYVPSRKIINTCRSYAQIQAVPAPTAAGKPAGQAWGRRPYWAVLAGVIGGIGLVGGLLTCWPAKPLASGLIIHRPALGQRVARLTPIAGYVANADTVWVVVHPEVKDDKYYVQDPILVKADGTWQGRLFVGPAGPLPNGLTFTIRAFVRPGGAYKALLEEEQYMYDSWPPQAELASEALRVVRQ